MNNSERAARGARPPDDLRAHATLEQISARIVAAIRRHGPMTAGQLSFIEFSNRVSAALRDDAIAALLGSRTLKLAQVERPSNYPRHQPYHVFELRDPAAEVRA